MFNTIELNDINLKILQTLKFIQTKNVTNQKKKTLTNNRVLSIFINNFIVHILFFIIQNFDHFLSSILTFYR